MATLIRNAAVQALEGRGEDAFRYQNRPHAGFNWPFVVALAVNALLWLCVAMSVGFWGSLVVMAVR